MIPGAAERNNPTIFSIIHFSYFPGCSIINPLMCRGGNGHRYCCFVCCHLLFIEGSVDKIFSKYNSPHYNGCISTPFNLCILFDFSQETIPCPMETKLIQSLFNQKYVNCCHIKLWMATKCVNLPAKRMISAPIIYFISAKGKIKSRMEWKKLRISSARAQTAYECIKTACNQSNLFNLLNRPWVDAP